jgi:hypothetical protein
MTKHKRPLPKTYRIERELIAEHNERMRRAAATYPGKPICPDCYAPPEYCNHI